MNGMTLFAIFVTIKGGADSHNFFNVYDINLAVGYFPFNYI